MYAVEFDARSEGNIIRLPKEHEELSNRNLRVMALLNQKPEKQAKQLGFRAVRLQTKGYKVNREEANERQGVC